MHEDVEAGSASTRPRIRPSALVRRGASPSEDAMSVALPTDLLPHDALHVVPWEDPVLDVSGHDPRSSYVEQFWLGILGPSTTWLLRRLADGLDERPGGFDLPLSDTARALGLGMKGGRNSAFVRALGRACTFRMAQPLGTEGLAVRRRLPPLNPHQLRRLPAPLQDAHRAWVEASTRPAGHEERRRRARRLALSLLELGETVEATERQLHRWRVHPAVAHEAVRWALEEHGPVAPLPVPPHELDRLPVHDHPAPSGAA